MRKSGYLARLEATQKRREDDMRWFAIKQSQDMALIALNRAFDFGPNRLKQFADALAEVWGDYAEMTLADAKDDPKIEYTKAKMDEQLKRICGIWFVPWEERYK